MKLSVHAERRRKYATNRGLRVFEPHMPTGDNLSALELPLPTGCLSSAVSALISKSSNFLLFQSTPGVGHLSMRVRVLRA